MYCAYQNREELEDELYQEDEGDTEGSEVNSELEFRLYSQLHYSSNAEGLEDRGEEAEGQDSQLLEAPDGEQEQTGESRPPSPDLSKLLQHLEEKQKKKKEQKLDNQKKKEKIDKQKKGKINSKNQRASSSFFEEVIVIDSGTDVISISEDDTAADDDEDGVCNSKGRGTQRQQTSTPAPQGSQKRSHSEPVNVVSSSSESDSEESKSDSSDSSSDSDALENWMILGRGQQDGDHSISLNLEGGSDSNEDAEEHEGSWVVSSKDREAQIYNRDKGARITGQRLSNRYYTSKNVQCRNCNKNGHLSKNCPEPKKLSPCFLCGTPGHLVSECPNKHCNNCGLPGHLFNSCSERAYWHQRCERCNMTGHLFNSCPEIWRQYHITSKTGPPVKQRGADRGRTPAYCYNCSRKGHFGHMCKQHRMFNGTYPSTPFINYYDTVKDIKCRQHWIMSKVKELKKNGFLSGRCQTPLTPGPPRKRQKTSYHKGNHQSNHTPRQSPHDHKPKGSHIFFGDDYYGATTPKQNRYNKHKQQEGSGKVKPWKPKRPVPTSRDSLPKSKLILDEAADFPRGGSKGENMKRKRVKKKKQAFTTQEGHKTGPGGTPGPVSNKEKGKKNRRNRARPNPDKQGAAQMYPTDENLFIIKQRKRSR
ncbi:zinc finger CCHC domain-containing protein 7 [Centropristis striata]|uniref:zinc finger CCHC domain-containing protein 7 n=1 Tax=Centropristis striata TaxID=184440 RepID=UPI0027DF661F|nr:zinc finger CCHC domain-containing protein 7 [Centropristis striata]